MVDLNSRWLSAVVPLLAALAFTVLVGWLGHWEYQRIERGWEDRLDLRAELMQERGSHALQILQQTRFYLHQTLSEADDPASEVAASAKRWPGLVVARVENAALTSIIPEGRRGVIEPLYQRRDEALKRQREQGLWATHQGALYRLGSVSGTSGRWFYALPLAPAMEGQYEKAEHWVFSFLGEPITASGSAARQLFARHSVDKRRFWRDESNRPWLATTTAFGQRGPVWWQVDSVAALARDYRLAQRSLLIKWIALWTLVNALLGLGGYFWYWRTRRILGQQRHDFDRERRELDDARRRLELALESSQSGHWDWDIEREQVAFSEHWKRMLGADAEACGDLTEWTGRIHPDDADECARRLRDHLKGETPMFEHEQRLRDDRGGYQWFLTRGRVIERARDGRSRRMTGVYTQVDERKRAQQMVTRQQQALEKLNEIAALPGTEADELLRRALQLGAEYLNLPLGIVSCIEGSDYTVQVQISPPGTLQDGQQFNLPECFCVETLRAGDVVAVQHTADSPLADHPCYISTQLESYIGAPLWVNGEAYGTINFSAPEPRTEPFAEVEWDFVRVLARWAGSTLERWFQDREIRQQAETFNQLANSLPGCLCQFQLNPDGHAFFPYASRGIYDVYGVSPEQARQSAKIVFDRIHEDDSADVQASVEASARQMREWETIFRYWHPRAGLIWVRGQISPMAQEDGSVLWHGYLREVTREIEAERQYKSSNRWRKAILDAASVSFIATDREGIIRTFNRGAEQMLGYRADELTGKHSPALIHVSDEVERRAQALTDELGYQVLPGFDVFVEKVKKGGTDEQEWTYVRKDGSTLPVVLTVTVVRDERGEIDGFLGVARDVSVVRAQAERIRNIAERTRTILDNAADGIIAIRGDGTIETFNKAAEKIFGWNVNAAIGESVNMLMPAADAAVHHQHLNRLRKEKVTRVLGLSRELQGLRKNGETFPIEIALSEIEQEGEPLYIGLVRDITERKRIEKMKNEFIATVSHELRTPLTSVSGSLRLLQSGTLGELNEKSQRLVNIAYSNSTRLIHLVNDLLDMEKLVAGKMVFDMQYYLLHELIEQSVTDNASYAQQYNVSIRINNTSLQQRVADRPVIVRVDRNRFAQVMANLLSNAIKFSPEGEAVEIRLDWEPKRVRISVIDRGPGIPEAFQPDIFKKFSQADSSTTKNQAGTGLGLSISKEMVERQDGSIGFESTLGQVQGFLSVFPLASVPAPR